MLAGVVFSSKVDGDSKPPCEQSRLYNDELREKEYAVFYNAILESAIFMDCAQFDGFLIKLDKVICENDVLISLILRALSKLQCVNYTNTRS